MAKKSDQSGLAPKSLADLIGVLESQLLADINAGCPTNPDGTMDLVTYLAWLIRECFPHGE